MLEKSELFLLIYILLCKKKVKEENKYNFGPAFQGKSGYFSYPHGKIESRTLQKTTFLTAFIISIPYVNNSLFSRIRMRKGYFTQMPRTPCPGLQLPFAFIELRGRSFFSILSYTSHRVDSVRGGKLRRLTRTCSRTASTQFGSLLFLTFLFIAPG